MRKQLSTEFSLPAVYELQHLRSALERLEGLGATHSSTIDNLKRVLLLQIVELEGSIDQSLRAQALLLYEPGMPAKIES